MSTLDMNTTDVLQLNQKTGPVIKKRYQVLSCRDKLTTKPSKEEEVPNASAPKTEKPRVRSMYKCQNIDEQGGYIFIKKADVCLQIPPGALHEKTFITIEVKSAAHSNMTDLDPSTILTPIVSCKPDGLKFKKPVELIVPHCAEYNDVRLHKATARFVEGDVCVSMDSTDKQDDVRCVLKERHCHIYTTHFSDAIVAISDCLKKRMLIVPFSERNSNLHVRVWIINDLPSEYTILQQELEDLNFTPFNHNAKFIFENRHEQCSIKVNFSVDDGIQTEVSKDISIQQLFQKFRNDFDFQLESTVTGGARRFVTVSLLKEPVFQLQKEIQDGDDVEKTQLESFDENEVQEDKMLPTPTESDGIFKRLCIYQTDLFKTISSMLSDIQRQYERARHEIILDEPGGFHKASLLPAIFKKITSFSEDIFWKLTPDDRELMKRISSFNTDILEKVSAFGAENVRYTTIRRMGHYHEIERCLVGDCKAMVSLHADIFKRMCCFTGDVLKIDPTMLQSDISTDVIGFLRDLLQVTRSFIKDSSKNRSDFGRSYFYWTAGTDIAITINAAKDDFMEAITLFAKDYQTMMPGSSKDFAELRSSIESDFSNLSVSVEEEWRSISRRENMKPITVAEMMTRQKTWEDERNQLISKLEAAGSKVKKHEKRLDDLQGEQVRVTEEAHQLKTDLANSVVLMKDNETLTEELKQNKADSDRQVEILIAKLEQSEQSVAEYDKKVGTLAEKLEQSEQSNVDLGRKIAILTEELEKAEQDKAMSNQKILMLTQEFHQSKVEFVGQIETLTKELKQTTQTNAFISEKLTQLKAESSKRIGGLTSELSETKQELLTRSKELGSTNRELEMSKQTLEKITQDRDSTRTELEKCQLDFAKESKALREVLNTVKDAMAALRKRPFENKSSDDSEMSGDIDEGVAILAAEFGRLTVAVAEYLTLEGCLKLAKVFRIPRADCDVIYRVSFIDSPAMKLLDLLKERNIVNMYDVTNLQKALTMLKLEAVNHNVVAPYQKTIGEEQYEQFKLEELFTWEDVNKFVSKVKLPPQQTSDEASLDDGTELGYTLTTEVTSETGEDRGSLIIDRPHHLLYTEQVVGREGGTIWSTNVSLTVPPDALHENHVIAISVMNESPFPLGREVDTARITPLIKLEPLGLTFKKLVQLNILHSALIFEPENHDVIIHSGQLTKTDDDSSDSIRWTEERSIPRQLKDKFVTVDIQCLTFISASLVSHTSLPLLHTVRAVPFVDRVRNTADDILLTICFCRDNDSEYNMLLSDYKTKLPLEQYSTLQLHRHSERDGDDAGFLSVTVTSVNNTYIPYKEQAMKKIAVSHLCTASRVSHQIRLKKEKVTYGDVVDILFTFTQAEYEPTVISLKARIKDLIISEESEKLVFGPISPDNKMYEDMLVNISSSLNAEQCKKFAAYFHLSSKDSEMITSNEDPGMMLMKILEERSLVHPQKVIHIFEGLKACHLDETSNLVTEYISKIPTLTPGEEQKPEVEEYIEAAMEKAFQELVYKGLNSLIGNLIWIWQVYSDYPLI